MSDDRDEEAGRPATAPARRWLVLALSGLAVLSAVLAVMLLRQPAGTPLAAGPGAGGGALTAAQREEVRALVRETLLANPELIPQAITALQSREAGQLLAARREEIETPFASAWAGAAQPDVVLVEFYDFACPYCRQSVRDVERLLAEDKGLRVVFRDLPVLSKESEEAALASLSAAAQGRHQAYYRALFGGEGRLTRERMIRGVRAAGLNELRTARDIASRANQAELKRNIELAQALGIGGTPAYVVGDQVLSGAVGYEALKAAIAKARAARAAAGTAGGPAAAASPAPGAATPAAPVRGG